MNAPRVAPYKEVRGKIEALCREAWSGGIFLGAAGACGEKGDRTSDGEGLLSREVNDRPRRPQYLEG
jgi:hypothetical protein